MTFCRALAALFFARHPVILLLKSSPFPGQLPRAMHRLGEKRPFDTHLVMRRIRQAVQPFPKAASSQLADEGYTSAFEQLIACIISVRTFDETTLVCARRLFALGRTPGQFAGLDHALIEEAISLSSFHEVKALRIHATARRVMDEYGGVLPCERDALLSLPGVGPKCANLVLAIACGENCISVDTHVHRIANRWGYIRTTRPEQRLHDFILAAFLPSTRCMTVYHCSTRTSALPPAGIRGCRATAFLNRLRPGTRRRAWRRPYGAETNWI